MQRVDISEQSRKAVAHLNESLKLLKAKDYSGGFLEFLLALSADIYGDAFDKAQKKSLIMVLKLYVEHTTKKDVKDEKSENTVDITPEIKNLIENPTVAGWYINYGNYLCSGVVPPPCVIASAYNCYLIAKWLLISKEDYKRFVYVPSTLPELEKAQRDILSTFDLSEEEFLKKQNQFKSLSPQEIKAIQTRTASNHHILEFELLNPSITREAEDKVRKLVTMIEGKVTHPIDEIERRIDELNAEFQLGPQTLFVIATYYDILAMKVAKNSITLQQRYYHTASEYFSKTMNVYQKLPKKIATQIAYAAFKKSFHCYQDVDSNECFDTLLLAISLDRTGTILCDGDHELAIEILGKYLIKKDYFSLPSDVILPDSNEAKLANDENELFNVYVLILVARYRFKQIIASQDNKIHVLDCLHAYTISRWILLNKKDLGNIEKGWLNEIEEKIPSLLKYFPVSSHYQLAAVDAIESKTGKSFNPVIELPLPIPEMKGLEDDFNKYVKVALVHQHPELENNESELKSIFDTIIKVTSLVDNDPEKSLQMISTLDKKYELMDHCSLSLKALIHLKLKNYSKAIEYGKSALNLTMDRKNQSGAKVPVHYTLGCAYFMLKNPRDAGKHFQFIFENDLPILNTGKLTTALTNDEVKNVQTVMTEILLPGITISSSTSAIDKKKIDTNIRISKTFAEKETKEDLNKAVGYIESALSCSPLHAESLLWFGEIISKQDNNTKTLEKSLLCISFAIWLQLMNSNSEELRHLLPYLTSRRLISSKLERWSLVYDDTKHRQMILNPKQAVSDIDQQFFRFISNTLSSFKISLTRQLETYHSIEASGHRSKFITEQITHLTKEIALHSQPKKPSSTIQLLSLEEKEKSRLKKLDEAEAKAKEAKRVEDEAKANKLSEDDRKRKDRAAKKAESEKKIAEERKQKNLNKKEKKAKAPVDVNIASLENLSLENKDKPEIKKDEPASISLSTGDNDSVKNTSQVSVEEKSVNRKSRRATKRAQMNKKERDSFEPAEIKTDNPLTPVEHLDHVQFPSPAQSIELDVPPALADSKDSEIQDIGRKQSHDSSSTPPVLQPEVADNALSSNRIPASDTIVADTCAEASPANTINTNAGSASSSTLAILNELVLHQQYHAAKETYAAEQIEKENEALRMQLELAREKTRAAQIQMEENKRKQETLIAELNATVPPVIESAALPVQYGPGPIPMQVPITMQYPDPGSMPVYAAMMMSHPDPGSMPMQAAMMMPYPDHGSIPMQAPMMLPQPVPGSLPMQAPHMMQHLQSGPFPMHMPSPIPLPMPYPMQMQMMPSPYPQLEDMYQQYSIQQHIERQNQLAAQQFAYQQMQTQIQNLNLARQRQSTHSNLIFPPNNPINPISQDQTSQPHEYQSSHSKGKSRKNNKKH